MFSVRALALALFAVSAVSAIQAESFERRHASLKEADRRSLDVETLVTGALTQATAVVGGVASQVQTLLAGGSSSTLISTLTSAIEPVQEAIAAALTTVQGITADPVQATSAAAQDVTSLIAAIEGIISQLEQAGADIPRLGSLVVTLSDVVNGPLSELLLVVDQLLVGVLGLVGGLLNRLGLGGVLSGLTGGLTPVLSGLLSGL